MAAEGAGQLGAARRLIHLMPRVAQEVVRPDQPRGTDAGVTLASPPERSVLVALMNASNARPMTLVAGRRLRAEADRKPSPPRTQLPAWVTCFTGKGLQ
jgi:hypothetical protein